MAARVAYSDFIGLFERCNAAIWPLQILGHLAGVLVLVLMFMRWRHSQAAIFAVLAPLWVFIGVVFQFLYLRPLYLPGQTFAVLWVVQGVLLALWAVRLSGSFSRSTGWYAILGWVAIGYSLVGYPVLGFLLRGSVLRVAWLAGFPCPMALFTLGVLVLARGPLPKWLLIVPGFWAIGGLVPFAWGIREDLGLVVLGLLIVASIVVRDRRIRQMGLMIRPQSFGSPSPFGVKHRAGS